MKIIITGGHLTPALAVIEEFKDQRLKTKDQILFIGRKYPLEGDSTISPEYKIITQMEIPFFSLTTGRLQRKFTRYTIPSLLKIPVGFFQSLWWVLKYKPDVILSFGGYVALPVVLTGWITRVPIVTHEQTVVSGLANKIIGFFAQKICVSWPQSMDHFPKDKVVLTGNPLRQEIFKIKKTTLYPMIYITGGSLGSHAINEAVLECLPQLLEKYVVIHQCGDSQKYHDWEKLKTSAFTKVSADKQKRYFLTKYVGPQDIGWVLNNADIVVSRAGANTVTELAALGKPALFIPLPWVGDNEQLKNAQLLVDRGVAQVLPQGKLTPENLLDQINGMMKNIKDYRENGEKVKGLVDPAATAKIVNIVNEVYAAKRRV